ncbi:MAG: hypothetical protein ABH950_08715 [Candidatus Altiarchaeota archaeon]
MTMKRTDEDNKFFRGVSTHEKRGQRGCKHSKIRGTLFDAHPIENAFLSAGEDNYCEESCRRGSRAYTVVSDLEDVGEIIIRRLD